MKSPQLAGYARPASQPRQQGLLQTVDIDAKAHPAALNKGQCRIPGQLEHMALAVSVSHKVQTPTPIWSNVTQTCVATKTSICCRRNSRRRQPCLCWSRKGGPPDRPRARTIAIDIQLKSTESDRTSCLIGTRHIFRGSRPVWRGWPPFFVVALPEPPLLVSGQHRNFMSFRAHLVESE